MAPMDKGRKSKKVLSHGYLMKLLKEVKTFSAMGVVSQRLDKCCERLQAVSPKS